MSSERDKARDAVNKLNKLTLEGKLAWSITHSHDLSKFQPDRLVGHVYEAKYKDNVLRLYKMKMKVEVARRPVLGLSGFIQSEPEVTWSDQVFLEMVDLTGITLWMFPQLSALKDLYSSVSYQVADVKNFLEDILETDEVSAQ